MLFFQLTLLAGYWYAHLLAARSTARRSSTIHLAVLAATVLALPIIPSAWWKPADGSHPLWRILGLLAITVGAPYFALASTSPLLQTWYVRARHAGVPYRFFALSNLGSMLALISYPIVIEPRLALRTQAWVWSGAYVFFAALCAWLAWGSARFEAPAETVVAEDSRGAPGWTDRAVWLLLAACASALLLAVTNHITQNVAAIPFLWVLPLSLYLLSFILTFESSRWYFRRLFFGLFAVSVASMALAIGGDTANKDLKLLIPLFTAGLFVCCMVCHGELVRRKPAPRHLTSFYLMIALGGAAGGLFVAAFAPNVFPAMFELPVLLVATPALILCVVFKDLPPKGDRKREFARAQFWSIWVGSIASVLFLAGYLIQQEHEYLGDARLLVRNFYGALRVTDDDETGTRELAHGTISHGEQYLDPVRRRRPTTYYAPKTGVGMLMIDLEKRGPVRLGVVGLGTGTMAAWGRAGDVVRYYEINPLVLRIARTQFTFLKDCPAKLDVVLGDARLSLDREPSQQFDVLAVDAFSGDSIPVHLLTREAFRIYWRHLRPDGILAVHVSNKYLDLAPPVAALGIEFHKEAHLIESEKEDSTQTFAADWVLIGVDEMKRFPWIEDQESEIDSPKGLRVWTDDFSNLWQVLR